jgi:hypothetical protein
MMVWEDQGNGTAMQGDADAWKGAYERAGGYSFADIGTFSSEDWTEVGLLVGPRRRLVRDAASYLRAKKGGWRAALVPL